MDYTDNFFPVEPRLVHDPLVTTVIPTRDRPTLVFRAVKSALDQTYANLEVVVVLDGPNNATESALGDISDSRLRMIRLSIPRGGSDARNAGVQAARGDWIALLDDDDEWMPQKIEQQVKCALASRIETPIVSSQILVPMGRNHLIWPRKAPSLPLCEYLLSRNSWSYGEGVLQTTTLFVPRRLLLEVPFTSGLRKHQDFDWLLRASERPDVGIEFIPEPLVVWHMDTGRKSVSTAAAWEPSWQWIRSQRAHITGRAYAGFLVTHVAPQAARQRAWDIFGPLLREVMVEGKPTIFHLVLYFCMWLTPAWLRTIVRSSKIKRVADGD